MAVAGSGTNVGVGGAKVGVKVAVTAGSAVLVGAGVDVNTFVGVGVVGYSVNCWEERVGKLNSVGVTVGVCVPLGKNPYAD